MPQRVLVVGPAWVGDMIMSQVIYSALRSANPDIVIDVLAPSATLSLVQRMEEVDRGILIKQGHGQLGFGYRRNLGRQLAERNYDQAIITPNSLKSALVPFFAGIPRRTGFLGEYRYFLLNDIKFLDKKRLPRMTDRFLALLESSGEEMKYPRLMVDEASQQSLVTKHGLSQERPIIGFCPGAEYGDAKKWPEAHYAALGRSLVNTGHDVWILGSPADAVTGEKIRTEVGDGCFNLAGKTSLPEVIDLLALCRQVVTNDSGLMHIAAAVGTKVIAVYGSTSPGFTPPLSKEARIASLELACSPCFKRVCPLGHKDCLMNLEPDRITALL
ncbi:MAG: lipopolysaccharide heptosyltransferase II [Gammaproteobacteria bacterium]|jgi:heptosyltransferase II|nr:lipopolysaccharide heptosyltransferase II [Gammaproteobacteria bacterium]MBT4494047.1 lipopolysaccharide heptosyltransferase II [Gammaproteobacteria bacterium]